MKPVPRSLFPIFSLISLAMCIEITASQQGKRNWSTSNTNNITQMSTQKKHGTTLEIDHKLQTQTIALLKRIGRDIMVTTHKNNSVPLTHILQNPELLSIISAYTSIDITPTAIPSYTSNMRGINNTHNLCYIIAPLQLAWELQNSLYQRNRLPQCIGQGGTDMCTLATSTLKAHELQEKTSAASSADIIFPLRDWLQQHAPDVYPLEKGQTLAANTPGFAHKVLELYLKHMNEQCIDSGMLAPCPTIKFLDGRSNDQKPIVEFMPNIIGEEGDYVFSCEEGITDSLKNLYPLYPLVVRMVAKAFNTNIQTIGFPILVKLLTPLGKVTYALRGALILDQIKSHSITLIRQGTQYSNWFIMNDHTKIAMNEEWIKEANEYNTIVIENTFPTDIIYERQ